jgi:chaperone modulatory protein CbpM
MIDDFHRDLAIDDEAMPVILDLIDRLHATRSRLRDLLQGVEALPEPARDAILRRLTGDNL